MDYRYETKNEVRDFHKQRKAFVIIDGKLEFLPTGSEKSHYEYCKEKGLSKDDFNKIIRGYYLNRFVVFYIDNFIYNEQVINKSLLYLNEISKIIKKNEFDIYFGQKPEENFRLDLFYGKYQSGIVYKSDINI